MTVRDITGRNLRTLSWPDRFWAYTEPQPNGCLLWLGTRKAEGYGYVWSPPERKHLPAYRVAYELIKGAIPTGLHIDHLCRQPSCVNPDHLEAVTQQENTRRGLNGILRVACVNGHPFTEENTYRNRGKRVCRACMRAAQSRQRARKKGVA